MRLSVFAYHIGLIMLEDAPAKLRLHPCEGVAAEIVIEPAQFLKGRVWDQVSINGRWCGNRHGAIQEFTALVIDAKPEVELD